jgi:hypothetical protein
VSADLNIRVINAATGEPLRELVLNPDRDYQPTGRPARPAPRNPTPRGKTKTRTLMWVRVIPIS